MSEKDVLQHSFLKRVNLLRDELKAQKSKFNKFGGYYYRSCEDIFEALKPLEKKYEITIALTSDIALFEGVKYLKVTAQFLDASSRAPLTTLPETVVYCAFDKPKGGMSTEQASGATISYATKYALGLLLLIDDGQDPDSLNTHSKKTVQNSSKNKSETKDTQTAPARDYTALKSVTADIMDGLNLNKQQAVELIKETYGEFTTLTDEQYSAYIQKVTKTYHALIDGTK